VHAKLTSDLEEIQKADKVIFPGEGEANSAMRQLQADGLDKLIPTLEQPFLGICLGMQLLCRHSEENNTPMLNIVPLEVKHFVSDLKVPHMGWNNIYNLKSPVMDKLAENDFVYFVHSYFVPVSEYTIATADYPAPFSAAVQYKNFYAVQFHTEKSGPTGSKILQNFLQI
jgi:glutamine amidotransferase